MLGFNLGFAVAGKCEAVAVHTRVCGLVAGRVVVQRRTVTRFEFCEFGFASSEPGEVVLEGFGAFGDLLGCHSVSDR